jgi:sugar lactone lactonase YvrE
MAIDLKSFRIRVITRLSGAKAEDCDGIYYRASTCGRPLGMRFESSGHLLVIDAYFGLFRVNVESGDKKLLALGMDDKRVPPEVRGLYNDLVLDPVNPDLAYVSVSSTRWSLGMIPWSLIEHENSGHILAVDLKKGTVTDLLDGIYFANGVELSGDQKYLLFSECTGHLISKISLESIRGALASGSVRSLRSELFSDQLPGEPDNVRLHGGDIYVGVAIGRSKGPTISDRLAQFPMPRKAMARLLYLTSLALDFVRTSLWQHPALEELVANLRTGYIMYGAVPKSGAIAVLDGNSGALKRILGSDQFSFISEAIIDENSGHLYFGSFKNRFIGKVEAKHLK